MKVFMKLILPVGLIAVFSLSAFAGNSLVPVETPAAETPAVETPTENQEITGEAQGQTDFSFTNHYIRMEGSVSETDGNKILVSGTEVGEIYYHLPESTLIYSLNSMEKISASSIKTGQSVTVFYNVMTPQALSFPPQVTPEIIVVNDNELAAFSKVDYFDEDLISSDGSLKLNLAEEMLIVGADNLPRTSAEARNKNLLVFFNISTRSIPAQTPPLKVVILDSEVLNVSAPDVAVLPEAGEPQLTETAPAEETSENEASQTESIIEQIGSEYIIHQDGVRFIALYKLAESLGHDLQWDGETATITLTKAGETTGYTFKAGDAQYEYNGLTMSFTHAPFIVNSRTYVEEGFLDIIK